MRKSYARSIGHRGWMPSVNLLTQYSPRRPFQNGSLRADSFLQQVGVDSRQPVGEERTHEFGAFQMRVVSRGIDNSEGPP